MSYNIYANYISQLSHVSIIYSNYLLYNSHNIMLGEPNYNGSWKNCFQGLHALFLDTPDIGLFCN